MPRGQPQTPSSRCSLGPEYTRSVGRRLPVAPHDIEALMQATLAIDLSLTYVSQWRSRDDNPGL